MLWVVLAVGALTVFIALGMRHAFGFFLDPITREVAGVSRENFGFAIALQNLVWGLGQPFAGMIADRYGSARVIFAGGLLYAAGLALTATASGPLALNLSLGVLVGFGLSCTSYAVVLGAVGRAFPADRRTTALGTASVGGSIGIFFSVPATLTLISYFGWTGALIALAVLALLMCVAAPRLSGKTQGGPDRQSFSQAMSEAIRHPGFILLLLGFFVCGFQLAFIGTHLPAFLADRNLDIWVGGAALTVVGATNVLGTLGCGYFGDRVSKKRLLAFLYFVRAVATVAFIITPISPTTTIIYAALMGLTWLGTVPLTSGIVAQVFGPQYLATLVGIVFLTHQVGSFLGAWLGGIAYETTGSYDHVWWMVALLGLAAALLHLPIDEKPIVAGPGRGQVQEGAT